MSSLAKILIVGVVWLGYTFLLFSMKAETKKPETEMTTPKVEVPSAGTSAVNTFPLGFRWSVDSVFTTDRFDALKESLLSKMDDNNILEITGLYYDGEDNPTQAATLGFARAEQVKALFAGIIPEGRIRLRARTAGDEIAGVRENFFEGVDFSWIKPEEKVEKTVKELKDRIIIRFAYGSAQKEYDPEVDNYLKDLAERIKFSGETVSLMGHTDNSGEAEFNQTLGMRRAKTIRDVLVRQGVKRDQITTNSKGEAQPVDSNDTEEGRHNNRRVEVRLNKK